MFLGHTKFFGVTMYM